MKRLLADPFALLTLGVAGFFAMHLLLSWFEESPQAHIEKAASSYQAGISTTSQIERKEQFNNALSTLLALEEKYAPTMGTGRLYANIGTVLFQLEEYPLALLYYYRAKVLRPRDETVAANLAAAQEKAHVKEPEEMRPMQRLFFFHYYFSVPERLQLFSLLFACAVICGSLWIWFSNYWLEKLANFWLILAMIFLASLAVSYYFDANEGVLLKPTLLYKGIGKQYATLSDQPEKAGSKVIILNSTFDQKWLKIQTENGSMGYVPQEAVQEI